MFRLSFVKLSRIQENIIRDY